MTEANWLAELLRLAEHENWCRRVVCTTCGALKFRGAVYGAALDRAGCWDGRRGDCSPEGWVGWARLSPAQETAVVDEVVLGLAALEEADCRDRCGLELLFRDVTGGFPGLFFPTQLEGTAAGEFLAGQVRARADDFDRKQETARRHEERARQEQEAARLRREAHAREVVAHAERKVVNDTLAMEWLAAMRSLTPQGRLERLCAEQLDASIDILPREMVPVDADVTLTTSAEQARLLQRIGARRGAWADLRHRVE